MLHTREQVVECKMAVGGNMSQGPASVSHLMLYRLGCGGRCTGLAAQVNVVCDAPKLVLVFSGKKPLQESELTNRAYRTL